VTVTRAATLLTLKHGLVRLDNVWGIGGGTRPVKSLIRQMVLLLKEYLSSGDIQEASRCLLELEVPHFHHELVYEVSPPCYFGIHSVHICIVIVRRLW
jgi:programmed cell death protein 4